MKKLGVCGDSFFSPISYDPNNLDNGHGKHFTEILCKKLGWELINFARGGCSNQTIRLQIDELIKHKPDVVIIGTTSPDRFEYPINHVRISKYDDKRSHDVVKMGYQEENGLSNIDYNDFPDKSAEHELFKEKKSVLFSDTLNNIFSFRDSGSKIYLEEYEIKILEKWYDRFYDFGWKTQTDTWIISDGIRKLNENNIYFFCVSSFLYEKQLYYSGNRLLTKLSPLNPNNYVSINENVPYRFHTTLENQELLSDLWLEHIIKHYGK